MIALGETLNPQSTYTVRPLGITGEHRDYGVLNNAKYIPGAMAWRAIVTRASGGIENKRPFIFSIDSAYSVNHTDLARKSLKGPEMLLALPSVHPSRLYLRLESDERHQHATGESLLLAEVSAEQGRLTTAALDLGASLLQAANMVNPAAKPYDRFMLRLISTEPGKVSSCAWEIDGNKATPANGSLF